MNEERLRRLLRRPNPPEDLERRILAGLPSDAPRRWPMVVAVMAVVVLLGWGVWPTSDPLTPFFEHAQAEVGLRGVWVAQAPPGVGLAKHCHVAGREYLHWRLDRPGGAVDLFLGPHFHGLPLHGERGRRLWMLVGLRQGAVLVLHPPGVDPLSLLSRLPLEDVS